MVLAYGSGMVDVNWYVKELHPVSYCRVYYIRSGYVIYQDEHIVKELKKGYLYIFPSTCPYEMKQDPSRRLDCLFLHINIMPHLLSELLELPVEEDSFLYHLLNAMDDWFFSREDIRSFDMVIRGMAFSLVEYLNKRMLFQSVPEKLSDTLVYITEHIGEKITVDMLSELSGYHAQYYIRLFCTHLGITPHQYLINYRMKLALSMLMENKSVSETADRVGYSELRNFSRAFKKYFGYSPNQVKKNIFPDR